jgi:phosphopantothenoylcysteine decarboxylase/phosphopantothenate--cysteine ligase
MNNKMWSHAATQANLAVLRTLGMHIIGPASGDQACGEQGAGRLVEPMQLIDELNQLMVPAALSGKQVVITAGPTYEPIDPVRFIGNRSSGKMGFAIAQAAYEAGADVILISGPVHLATPTGVQRIDVETAQQMHQAVMASVEDSDIFISCAAVADYRPEQQHQQKIKKESSGELTLSLIPNIDIVNEVTRLAITPFVVGFAAETEQLENYAQSKLINKKLDMIAANKVGKDLGFAVDSNELNVYWNNGQQHLPFTSKKQLARNLMSLIIEQYHAKNST